MINKIPEEELLYRSFEILKILRKKRQNRNLSLAEIKGALKKEESSVHGVKESIELLLSRRLLVKKGAKYSLGKKLPLKAQGVLSAHHRGFGFVSIEGGLWGEVFIPKQRMRGAVDGDLVEVKIDYTHLDKKGPEGSVESILKRHRKTVIGIIKHTLESGNLIAHSALLNDTIIVKKPGRRKLKEGDRISIKVLNWGGEGADLEGELETHLGTIYDPSIDINIAMKEYELTDDFPKAVIKELEEVPSRVLPKDYKGRVDFRNELTVTIDPKTAKDFDDALTFKKHRNGESELYVHIADVSHYVPLGSALDKEAVRRGNSTYFPGKCVPMIPPALADNLCSLKPNVVRLTVTVRMHFDENTNLIDYDIVKGVIKSKKRYTYEQVQAVLDGTKKDQHAKTLRQMATFSQKLRKKRKLDGAVEISTKETMIHVDENGVPTGTVTVDHDVSHQLVEECMILTNQVVATHLQKKSIPGLYRIHEPPSDDNMKDFLKAVQSMGFPVSKRIDGHFLNTLFEKVKDDPIGPFIVTSYIRSMRLAVYDVVSKGHYGLNIDHYSHFTSPIRRYPDLVVHRAIFGEPLEETDLAVIAKSVSDTERLSAKAEGSVLQLKKLRLLSAYFDEDPERVYKAVVTKILPFGMVVSVEDLLLEGMVHVSDFFDDYYVYDEDRVLLTGRHTKTVLRIGSEVSVILKDIDLITGEAKWAKQSSAKKRKAKDFGKSFKKGKKRHRKGKQ